ncbi:long-chain fatty acid--CoA ligase [Leekyejoonella antrihumi]|nr:long-chain fatty acid--CoA ligase [Leekyejoonella antrihumi]
MQARPLTIAHAFDRAERLFSHKTIATARSARTETVDYGTWAVGVRRLAAALDALAVPVGARVATFARNHQEHLDLYFAVPVTKRVLHTINIRQSSEQLRYIVDDAQDDVVFVDRELFATLWASAGDAASVRHWVIIPDGSDVELPPDPRIIHFADLVGRCEPCAGSFEANFGAADENLASGLCYTSGTTGRPKGVVYTHRSTMLHSLGVLVAGLIGMCERDVVMPVVPMFHANAWGLPYSAVLAGSKLVLPGSSLDPVHLLSLIEAERVTLTAAVPTVWLDALPHLEGHDLSSLRMVIGGGSAISPSLSEAYRTAIGIPVTHSWGMTEMSPTGVIGGTRSQHDGLAPEALVEVGAAQGQPMPLVNLRIVDLDTGVELPWNGTAIGELEACGPWVAAGYLHEEGEGAFTDDGWLRTGDIATIGPDGYVRLVDRIKDLIKSGGEWISSVQLESAIASHPAVVEAAVIGRPDPRWIERPVAYVVLKAGAWVSSEELLAHLAPQVAKWWIPDEFVLVESLPRTGTGKISKVQLRQGVQST